MKFELSPRFRADWSRLSPSERALFQKVAQREFEPAIERRLADPSAAWPAKLRIRRLVNAPGIWEMTWSFAGPDGSATFEFIRIDGRPGIRWRRIAGHAIFGEP